MDGNALINDRGKRVPSFKKPARLGLAALALSLATVFAALAGEPVRMSWFSSDPVRSWNAEAQVTTYREGNTVENAEWQIAFDRTATGETRTFRVTKGPGIGDVYVARRTSANPASTVARELTTAKRARTQAIDTGDADDNFANTVLALRDLDSGYESWPVRTELTRARVDGLPVTSIDAARAPDAPKRLGSWRFMVMDNGIVPKIERFDKKGRITREFRMANFADVDGATFAHKWEVRDIHDRSRTVVNLRNVRVWSEPKP